MKNFIKQILADETGSISSKRVCGIICTVMLCSTLFANQFTPEHILINLVQENEKNKRE